MDKFTIGVIFRKASGFVRHNVDPEAEITGVMVITTDRCDVEAILAEYNVAKYLIMDCSNRLQIMREPKEIPKYYYDEV